MVPLRVKAPLVSVVVLFLVSGCTSADVPAAAGGTSSTSVVSLPRQLRMVVLGDSNANQSGCPTCIIFPNQLAGEIESALGAEVEVLNLSWELDRPKAAEVLDILDFVRSDAVARDALAGADVVVLLVAQNDLAYNRLDDPCGVAPSYPRVEWENLTHDCMDTALSEYSRDLDALLSEVGDLRAGSPTMLRVVTAINTTIGDRVDPTWDSPEAVEPSAYAVVHMVEVQCAAAESHGGKCADLFHALNGPDGTESAQRYLNPLDATHLAQQGHSKLTAVLVSLGFDPLTGTG